MTCALFQLVVSMQQSAASAEKPTTPGGLLALCVLLQGSRSASNSDQMSPPRTSPVSHSPVRKTSPSEEWTFSLKMAPCYTLFSCQARPCKMPNKSRLIQGSTILALEHLGSHPTSRTAKPLKVWWKKPCQNITKKMRFWRTLSISFLQVPLQI